MASVEGQSKRDQWETKLSLTEQRKRNPIYLGRPAQGRELKTDRTTTTEDKAHHSHIFLWPTQAP